MQDIEAIVLEALKDRTKENPLTRTELRQLVGTRDSNARGVIQSLRSHGYRIVSSAGARGYWITHDEVEYRAFIEEYGKKARTILHNIRKMNQFTEGQETINGL